MSDNKLDIPDFLLVALASSFLTSILFLILLGTMIIPSNCEKWKTEIYKQGHAEYSRETGEWQWKETKK